MRCNESVIQLQSNRDAAAIASRRWTGCFGEVTVVRLGLARNHPSLPDIDRQRELLIAEGGCASVVDIEAGAAAERRLEKSLAALPPDSVVCVVSLDVLGRPLPDLVRLLRDLGELSISVAIVSPKEGETLLVPQEDVVRLLRHLSAYNGRQFSSPPGSNGGTNWYGRSFRAAGDFNRHQVVHARKLYGEGMSLREIGLIFQTSPEEVWKVVS